MSRNFHTFIVVLILSLLLSLPALADNSGTCGENLTWSLEDVDDETKVLRISGTGPMVDYSGNESAPWNDSFRWQITSVEIGQGVTSIGNKAFTGCSGLTSVSIPTGVTKIGDYAFSSCNSLTDITIPEGVTSIGNYALWGYNNLTNVTIPDSVTSIGEGAFSNCNKLKSITIGSGVRSIGRDAFYDCDQLTAVHIHDLKAWLSIYFRYDIEAQSFQNEWSQPLRKAHHLYLNGQEVTSVTIPDGVKWIGYFAFSGCTGLTSVTIPDSVEDIRRGAFYGCTGLTSITIPDSVKEIQEFAFSGCTSLTEATIQNGVTHIGNKAFSGCSSLTDLTIPSSVEYLGTDAFNGTPWLEANQYFIISGNHTLLSYEGEETEVTIPDGVTSIGNYAFNENEDLISVIIPDGVTSIRDGEYGAFFRCSSLTTVAIPDSMTRIGDYAFQECYSLTDVDIPEGVTSIGDDAFAYCSSLTEVTIPGSVKSIGDRAFYDCYEQYGDNVLSSVTFSGSAPSIGEEAFHNAEADVYYNSGFDGWTEDVLQDYGGTLTWHDVYVYETSGTCGDNLIWSLDSETNILTISGTGPMYDYDEVESAPWCDSHHLLQITDVQFEQGVTDIGDYAFYSCSNLMTVTIPEGVRSIGYHAFEGCSSLTNVTIPGSVTSIGGAAFADCDSLKSVTFAGDAPSIYEGSEEEDSLVFYHVAADVYYNSSFDGWTEGVLQDYGGTLTWHDVYELPVVIAPVIETDPEYEYGQTIRIEFDLDPNAEYYETSDGADIEYDEEAGKGTLVFKTYGWSMKEGENTITVQGIGKSGCEDSEVTTLSFTVNPMVLEVIDRYDWTYYRSGERVGIAFCSLIDDYYTDRELFTVTVTDPNGKPVEAEPSFFDRKSEDGLKYWMVLFDQYDWFDNGYEAGTYTITVTAYDEGWEKTCTESRTFTLKEDEGNGFAYRIDEDGSLIIVDVTVDGNHMVTIPESINGMEVKTISAAAFQNVDTADVTVKIPKTILKVEKDAIPAETAVITPQNSCSWFYGKAYHWELTDDEQETVATIGLPEHLSSLSANAFEGIDAECIILPEGCSVDSGALAGCKKLKTVVFHEKSGTLNDIFGEEKTGSGILLVNAEFGEAESILDVEF